MTNPSDGGANGGDDLVHELIAEFHRRRDLGESIEPAQFASANPEVQAELSRYFDNVATLESMAGPTVETASPGIVETIITADTQNGAHTETVLQDSQTGPPNVRVASDAPLSQFGRYRILKELGRGAMGAVYLAHDQQLDREIALKIPQFGQDMDPGLLERFYREARAAAALRHPGICPVFDVGEIDGQHYITMAFIKGRPLRDFTKTSKTQGIRQIVRVIRKLAMALAEAHRHKVVHRDLKPANIMIDERKEPVVMDFGLARRSAEGEEKLTHSGTVIGTPAYMSPEQVDGDNNRVGPTADIYSLGVIFYELVAGQLPFQGNLMSILKQIATVDPRPASELRPDLPDELQSVIQKMMAKEIEDRFQSMDEVAAVLTDFLKDQQAATDESGMMETSKGPSARHQPQIPLEETEPFTAPGDPEALQFQPQIDTSDLMSATAARTSSKPPANWKLIGATLGGIAILLAGIVFFVQLGKVTVQITLNDPQYQLKVDGNDVILKGGSNEIRLSADEHRLTVMQGDLVVDAPKSFTVTRDGKNAITVFVVDKEVLILPDGERPPALPDESTLTGQIDHPLIRGTVDLLALLKPARDFPVLHLASGLSIFQDGTLRTPAANEFFTAIFRCPVPEQYEIQLQLERKSGKGEFSVGIVMGGQQATVGMDLGDKPKWGLENIDGRTVHEPANPTRTTGGRFRTGEVNHVTIRVLKDRIILVHEDEIMFDWKGTPNQLSLWKSDDLPPEPCLFFRSKAAFHVYKMVMTPITDRSAAPRATAGTPSKVNALPLAIAPFDDAQATTHQQVWADYLGESVETTNSIGIKLVVIPPGTFKMGEGRNGAGGNIVDVTLTKPFRIGIREVTQAQWKAVVGTEPWKDQQSAHEGDTVAATNISWHAASAFCQKLTEQERSAGRLGNDWQYRLPTEAEWEFACRAGTTTPFSFGDDPSQLGYYGWYLDNAKNAGADHPHPVGQKKPNAWGLFDVHGNVWECCFDVFEGKYAGGTDPMGPSTGDRRAKRGGAWMTPTGYCWSATRTGLVPSYQDVSVGFRVALVPVDGVGRSFGSRGQGPNPEKATDSHRIPASELSPVEILTSPDWIWSAPVRLGESINSKATEAGPALSTDGNTLLFNRSGEDGRVDARGLLMSTRSPSGEWSSPDQLPGEIGDIPGLIEPHLHLESGVLYLTALSLPGRVGAADLFVSRRDPEASTWSAPEPLGKTVNSSAQDQAATLSADGLTLIFHSDRDGGQGYMDLWISTRESTDSEWSTPVNAGSDVNSDEWETHPCLSSDGLVLLFVRRETSTQSHRLLLQTTRTDRNAPWQAPTRITFEGKPGPSLNSPTLSGDGKTLIFSAGNAEDYDLMISHRIPAKAK